MVSETIYLLRSANGTIHRPRYADRALCGARMHTVLAFIEDIYDHNINDYRDLTSQDVTCSRCKLLQDKDS